MSETGQCIHLVFGWREMGQDDDRDDIPLLKAIVSLEEWEFGEGWDVLVGGGKWSYWEMWFWETRENMETTDGIVESVGHQFTKTLIVF